MLKIKKQNQGISTPVAIIVGAIIVGLFIFLGLNYSLQQKDEKKPSENQTIVNPTKNKKTSVIEDKKTVEGNIDKPTNKSVGLGKTENTTEMEDSNRNSATPSNNTQPSNTNTSSDEDMIRQALVNKTAIPANKMEMSIGDNTGQIARGTVKSSGSISGAGWFAAKVNGQWAITYVGQGVPKCNEVNPYNYPIAWADYCLNTSGQTVHR